MIGSKPIVASLLAAFSGTLLSFPALAKPTEAELLDALMNAKILSGEYRINLVTQESQATLSTFLDKASKTSQADDDCKINAVLMAKKIMDMDSDLVRVKVLFYDVNGQNFRQVVVKAGDVLALGGGQIDKEKLLSSLEVIRGSRSDSHSTPAANSSSSGAPTSGSATPTGSATATGSATPTPTVVKPSAAKPPVTTAQIFNAAGISFSYPKDWIPKRGANASVLAHFFSSTLGEHNYIDVDFFNQNRTVEGFADEKYQEWVYQPNYQVVYSGPMKLGAKGTIAGISRLVTYQVENYPEYRYYQRHVFFGQPGRIYCLRYHAQYQDMQKVNAAFEHMLVTLQAQGLSPTVPPSKSTGGKKRK